MERAERHVLVVFPHPDDESFAAAGTIALYAQSGIPVTYACGTLGEMGRNMGNPVFANRETLPAIRKKELEKACQILGIRDLRLLGFRDKTIEFEDPEEVADRIERIIREIRPSLIITFYPGYAVHPDHDALGEAVVRAAARLPASERPVIYCHAFARNSVEDLGKPDVEIDVSSVFHIKLAAIKAHRSQTEKMVKMWESSADPSVFDHWRKEYFWIYNIS